MLLLNKASLIQPVQCLLYVLERKKTKEERKTREIGLNHSSRWWWHFIWKILETFWQI